MLKKSGHDRPGMDWLAAGPVYLVGGAGVGRSVERAPCLFIDGILLITSFLKNFQDFSLFQGDLMNIRS
jgi:hypothetical protein